MTLPNSEARVLLVDDDRELCQMLTEYLNAEHFDVTSVHDGGDALERLRTADFEILILDVMLPSVGGFDVLRKLGASYQTPILMLTARGDDIDRIVGLELGADDYLSKPFNPRELVARIRAILRRTQPDGGGPGERLPERLTVDDVAVEVDRRLVRRAGAPVELTAVEFALLELLMRAAGSVVRREDLARGALGRSLLPFDRSIDVHVSRVRKKLGPRPDGGERITTLRAVGYLYTRQGASGRL